MPEILSQREIDSLLGGADPAAAAAAAPEVAPYDFACPARLSKERKAALETVWARFAAALQSLLSTRLRTTLDVVVAAVEQNRFSEFALALGSPAAAFVFQLGDRSGGNGVLDLGAGTAYFLVDRLFGGTGEPLDPGRRLTPLEQLAVRGVTERALQLLREAWEDQLPLNPELVGFESDPDMLQGTAPGEEFLVVHLELRAASFTGPITVGLPLVTLEPFLQGGVRARTQSSRPGGESAGPQRAAIESGLQHALLSLVARFPLFSLSVKEIAGLQPGQVVHAGHPADVPVEVHVNGKLRFLGMLGQVRKRVGLQISNVVPASAAARPGRIREGRVS